MKLLALDLSTNTGWAVFSGERGQQKPDLIEYGLFRMEQAVLSFSDYPWCFPQAAMAVARKVREQVIDLRTRHRLDGVVIEETNLGRNRYTQKLLEMIHYCVLEVLREQGIKQVWYVSSSEWRRAVDLKLSVEDKKNNGKLAKAKRQGVSKKTLGIKGKITKKHLSVRYVNHLYDLDFILKDNDIADAICLAVGWFRGAELCNGE